MEKKGNIFQNFSCEVIPCRSEYGEGWFPDHCSSRISWQHFPISLSSRSSCNLSSEYKASISASQTSAAIYKDEKSPTGTPSSIFSGPAVKTISQLQANHYLQLRCIFEFFTFLIGHLICTEPEDPVEFLVELIDKCILARNGDAVPPLLFSDHHMRAVYEAFDPFDRGSINWRQYGEAMRSLGLSHDKFRTERNPSSDDKGPVSAAVFMSETKRLLADNFKKMTRIPKKWEENRLVYLRRMSLRRDFEISQVVDVEEECEGESEWSVVNKGRDETNCFCTLPKTAKHESKTKTKHEPEQLFLSL